MDASITTDTVASSRPGGNSSWLGRNSLIVKAKPFIIPLAIAATMAVVFAQVGQFNFLLWDDDLHITENKWMNPVTTQSFIHFWKNPFEIPVTFSFWALEKSTIQTFLRCPDGSQCLAGYFHIVNLCIHIANALLVYGLILMLVRRRWLAGVGALLFGLHPVQVEAVAWISSLKDLLSTFDLLTDSEKYEAASQLLRRVIEGESGDIPEDALVGAGEQLFLDLDARESGNGQS